MPAAKHAPPTALQAAAAAFVAALAEYDAITAIPNISTPTVQRALDTAIDRAVSTSDSILYASSLSHIN